MTINKKEGTVFFYCRANPKIGTGHFWRSFRIADELKQTGTEVYFLSEDISDQLIKVLEENTIGFIKVYNSSTNALVSTMNSVQSDRTMLVIDSDDTKYYSVEFQNSIMENGIKLMLITINPNFCYTPNILLNQNIMSLSQDFKVGKKTTKLFGPKYLVFDKQFHQIQKQNKGIEKGIFLAFGGADPMGYSFKILEHLLESKITTLLELHVVIGKLNKDAEKIVLLCKNFKGVSIYQDTKEMKNIMAKCSLAICSPGMIFWEASLMGLRSILLSSSKRERPIAEFLGNHRYAFTVGHFDQEMKSGDFKNIEDEILNPNQDRYTNLASLRKSINPQGIHLITNEINTVLAN